jgi:hypothetical protein
LAKMNLWVHPHHGTWSLLEPWLQRTSDKLSVGTDQIRALIE